MAVAVRKCSATTKAGKPCNNPVVLESGLCVTHDPDSAIAANFATGHPVMPGAGRPKRRRWHEIVNAELEAETEKFLAPYRAAIAAGDDPELGMKAVERLLNRLDGTPTQRSEVEHSGSLQAWLLAGKPLDDSDGDV